MEQSNEKKIKVAVGLSGGVDSAVSAYLLKKAGYDVTGVYVQCWEKKIDGCAADEDKAYALQTAVHLEIPFKHLDFIKEYKDKVIEYFYSEYKSGRTPNPDVMCNKEIKFGMFYNWAMKEGFDYIATGHYSRVSEDNGIFKLLKGVDSSKDQSYFLYQLDQDHLKHILFPVGDMEKKSVRKIAEEQKLPPYKRPESMGICFIGEVDIKEFLEKEIAHKEGLVKSISGNVIGSHTGIWFYTIGQRHGFHLDDYYGVPMYVIGKIPEMNELIVGTQEEAMRNIFDVESFHWVGEDPFVGDILSCDVRIRHLGKLHSSKVEKLESGFRVTLDTPVFGVAPGQSAVLYKGDEVLGGGVISK